jgi:thymidylate synthase (FAD)
MRFIKPKVEFLPQEPGLKGMWKLIATATRNCYDSKPREGETDEAFVRRVILPESKKTKDVFVGHINGRNVYEKGYDFDKIHGSMLEHGAVYLTVPNVYDLPKDLYEACYKLKENKFARYFYKEDTAYISTNMRVIVELGLEKLLKFFTEPTKYHSRRYTFRVTTDIGVSREGNRHRANSTSEQSTRYVDFTKNSHGGEIQYPVPTWMREDEIETRLSLRAADDESDVMGLLKHALADGADSLDVWLFAMKAAEFSYERLRGMHEPTDHARQVLNLNTRTSVVWSAFDDDWEHFFRLRADDVSGHVHPNMGVVANIIKAKYVAEREAESAQGLL